MTQQQPRTTYADWKKREARVDKIVFRLMLFVLLGIPCIIGLYCAYCTYAECVLSAPADAKQTAFTVFCVVMGLLVMFFGNFIGVFELISNALIGPPPARGDDETDSTEQV